MQPRAVPGGVDIAQTPFLPLSQLARVSLLSYLVVYRIIFPLITALMSDGSKDLLAVRFVAELFYTCLISFPFIFYRREYGWLHPLVLPTLYEIGKTVGKNPLILIFPFHAPLVNFTVESQSTAAVLSIPNIDLAWARLNLSLIQCLGQATYLGFFLFCPTFKVPRLKFYQPRNLGLTAGVTIALLVAIAAIFVVSQGGLTALLVAMRGGRRALFAGNGLYIVAGVVAPMIAMTWFVYLERPWTNIPFLVGLAAALVTPMLVSGSRSSLIMPVLAINLIWWKKSGRALIFPTVGAALLGLIVIGGFGAIRQDYGSSVVDTSVFNVSHLGSTVTTALDDIEKRDAADPDLAVIAGASQKGFLWGRSYINAAMFWVPRALWADKPQGIDLYNMWINFNGNSIDSKPRDWGTWGIPVGPEMEGYWNFNIPGVILVFALLGIFNATWASAAHIYRRVPIFWVAYIYTILNVFGTSKSMTDWIRNMATLALFALVAGIFRFSAAKRDGAVSTRVGATS